MSRRMRCLRLRGGLLCDLHDCFYCNQRPCVVAARMRLRRQVDAVAASEMRGRRPRER